MIPLEAVEAAMIAFANAPYDPPPTTEAQINRANQEQMKLALEAAAPHILAGGPSLGERFAQELYDEFYYMGPRDEPTP